LKNKYKRNLKILMDKTLMNAVAAVIAVETVARVIVQHNYAVILVEI
jgi:hypothetical protein